MIFSTAMTPMVLITTLVILSYLPHSARSICSDLTNKFVTITEQDPNGTEIFNVSKSASDQVTFSVGAITGASSQQLQEFQSKYFSLTQNSTFAMLTLTNQLDLELLHKDYNGEFTTIPLTVHCGNPTFVVTIINEGINEFPPVFNGAPFAISLSESTPLHSSIFNLKDKTTDEDIPQQNTFYYYINRYLIPAYDARAFFYIPTTTRGIVETNATIDYDTLPHKNIFLNVSVSDGTGNDRKWADSYINITVTDADDQAPYFDYPGCGKPCVAPPYSALVSPSFSGAVPIHPDMIKAKDDDTLGTQLLFSIQGNNYGHFTIHPNTGVVTMTQSVAKSGSKSSQFRLIIKVRKNLTIDLSAIAILTVQIEGREPNGTNPIGPVQQHEESHSTLLIPVIILGVLLAVLIVAAVVVFILIRRKQKQMLVSPEHDKSEPQTEEEEIHDTDRSTEYNNMADSNEKLIFSGGKTTRGISTDMYPVPMGKANQLPPLPLRDTATETTEGRKKKRSRKRNRVKEPEVFDGTREYNMGADPEFFDSTDKSKIKRSQRSKKNDSTLPINVPNDQPELDDSHSIHM